MEIENYKYLGILEADTIKKTELKKKERSTTEERNVSKVNSTVEIIPVILLLVWFGFFWFYGISTIVGYLMPNPLYTYI